MAKVTEGDPYYYAPFRHSGEYYAVYKKGAGRLDTIVEQATQDNASLIVDALNVCHITEPVYQTVDRILDDFSGWVARPNREISKKIALRAVLAAHRILTEALEEDAKT